MKPPSDQFPGFDQIHVLRDPLASTPYRGSWTERGSFTRALVRGEARPTEPVIVRHQMGGSPRDIIWTSAVWPLIVTEKVVHLLEDQRFSGWMTYSVRVLDPEGKSLPGYWGLGITGRCGPLQTGRSEDIIVNVPGVGMRHRRKGLYFDPETWDGSDFFLPDGSFFILIVEAVRRALRHERIRNISVVSLSEFVWHPETFPRDSEGT